MFTSNGKLYTKREACIDLDSGLRGLAPEINRGYNEDLLAKLPVRTGHSSEPDVIYDDNHFDRRLPPQSSSNREYEEDQRKVHFRNGRRRMYGRDGFCRGSGIRNGGFDEGSSVSSDQRYGGSSRFAKMPPEYLRAPQEYLRTPPEFKTPPNYRRTTPELKTPPEYKTPPDFTKTPREFAKSHSHAGHQSHSNQLLNLRAALNEKELQLVELREQHIIILHRAADARQNWEEALKSKDRVILQLQRTLQHKKAQLDRQERENQENLHVLRKRQKEEDTAVEKKELTVALLEAKNAQFVQELVEQQKLITRMKRHIDEKEKLSAGQHQKLEMMNGRVQDLKAALQGKEEEADTQSKYCNELKTLLWKRDSIIAQLQLSEQQLQSNLAREVAAYEAVSMCRDKVQEEKALLEKRLSEMQSQCNATGNGGSGHQKGNNESEIRKLMELKDDFSNVQEGALKDLDDREGVMHRIQKRMRELQRSLRNKNNALSDKNNELQQALLEIQRLTEEYEALKQDFEEVNKRNDELETTLAQRQDYTDGRTGEASISEAPVEVLPYEFSQGGSTGEDLGVDDPMLDSVESLEQLSNASVYHANFEKIIEVEMPDIDPQQQQQQQQQEQQKAPVPLAHTHLSSKPPTPKIITPPPPAATSPRGDPLPAAAAPPRASSPPVLLHNDELDATYNSIQDEIMKREQCWRKTEELMRAALTRRMKLLEEAKEVHSSETNVTWSAIKGLELHNRSGHVHNHQHRLQEETSARGNTDSKIRMEQENRIERRKQIGNGNSLHHHVPHRKILREDGHIYHEPDGARGQQQSFEQDIYLGGKTNRDVDHFKTFDNGIYKLPHQHGVILDRPKRVDRTNHLDSYKYYERNGQNGRSGRTQKGSEFWRKTLGIRNFDSKTDQWAYKYRLILSCWEMQIILRLNLKTSSERVLQWQKKDIDNDRTNSILCERSTDHMACQWQNMLC